MSARLSVTLSQAGTTRATIMRSSLEFAGKLTMHEETTLSLWGTNTMITL